MLGRAAPMDRARLSPSSSATVNRGSRVQWKVQLCHAKTGKASRGFPGKDHTVFGRLLGHVRLMSIRDVGV